MHPRRLSGRRDLAVAAECPGAVHRCILCLRHGQEDSLPQVARLLPADRPGGGPGGRLHGPSLHQAGDGARVGRPGQLGRARA
eukprot:scaffold108582_cov21-Phaeocystis_antarctica.AAC.1